jgi:hypothetical protein
VNAVTAAGPALPNQAAEPGQFAQLLTLSLGAGVQSTTIALMAAEGLLPKPDLVLFADTGWEPAAVYQHLARLETVLDTAGMPVRRVSAGNLRNDALDPEHRYASIPYHIRKADGGHGMGRRQCTAEYKISPINRAIRETLGAPAPHFRRVPRGRRATVWIGFSADEIGRVRDSHVSYIRHAYPLIDLGMDREACRRWLDRRGWSVAKSACIGCPYTGNAGWRRMRDEHPAEFADAIAFDAAIRHGGARGTPLIGQAFVHRSRLPLDQAPIDRLTRAERRGTQLDLLAELGDPDGCSPNGCRSGTAD